MRKVKLIYNPNSGEKSIVNSLDFIISIYQKHNITLIPYRIDKKGNGKWKEAPKVIDDAFFNMPAYQPDENNEIVREINWEWIYGKLTPGTYRFVTDASDEKISVTFVIK